MTAELPLKDIDEADIDDNDILLGRGGKTNHHPGEPLLTSNFVTPDDCEISFVPQRC